MKKDEASLIQYRVFRKLFSKENRVHKRRVFLSQALEDLYGLCGYSPDQIYNIVRKIVETKSFNHFYGVVIPRFDLYSKGYQPGKDVKIEKISITLSAASLSFPDFFKRKSKYKICYFRDNEIFYTKYKELERF
jgi:hypothetical protein